MNLIHKSQMRSENSDTLLHLQLSIRSIDSVLSYGNHKLTLQIYKPIEESLKKQISALLSVINVTRCCKEDNVPCKIEEGLFLGSIGAAHNRDELRNLNITHILTVAGSLAPAYPNDFVYKVLNVMDKESTDLKQHFDECFDYIEEAKRSGGVLVHCFVGKSRSVTIVLAYLMKKHGLSLSEALEHVRSRQPQASPNSGFMSQLQRFERSLHANEENKTI